jgi:hypothetical protein
MSYWADKYERNPIADNDREESRSARRFAPTHIRRGECNHVGGIKHGGTECTLCGDGPC